ncbi:MAG: HdaA/DnaA family protein [Saezia sp.]
MALLTHPDAGFDNFVPGSNLDCMLHLKEQAASLFSADKKTAPAYLWGGGGCGKTHLLKAVAEVVTDCGGSCLWLTPKTELDFLGELEADVILLDDCEQFSQAHQATAFRAFINAQTYGFWMLAAGSCPPVDLPVREDLRTRLGWGHVFALKTLSEEELQAALWHAFHSRGLELSAAVQSYLLSHFARDMSSLMYLLAKLDRYALASKRAVTVPLIKNMLEEDEVF